MSEKNTTHRSCRWKYAILTTGVLVVAICAALLYLNRTKYAEVLVYDLIEVSTHDGGTFLVLDHTGRIESRSVTNGSRVAHSRLHGELYAFDYSVFNGNEDLIVLGTPNGQSWKNRTATLWNCNGESLQLEGNRIYSGPEGKFFFSEHRLVVICAGEDEHSGRANKVWYSKPFPSDLSMKELLIPKDLNAVQAVRFLNNDAICAAVSTDTPVVSIRDWEVLFFETGTDDPVARVPLDKRDRSLVQLLKTSQLRN
jgi:hypothetical protein